MAFNINKVLTKESIAELIKLESKKERIYTFLFILHLFIVFAPISFISTIEINSFYNIILYIVSLLFFLSFIFSNKFYSKMINASKNVHNLSNFISDYSRINNYCSLKSVDNYRKNIVSQNRDLTLYEFNNIENYYFETIKYQEKLSFFKK